METVKFEVYCKDCTSAEGRKFKGYSIKIKGVWYRLIPNQDCPALPKDVTKFWLVLEKKVSELTGKVCIYGISGKETENGYYNYYLKSFVGTEKFEFEDCIDADDLI